MNALYKILKPVALRYFPSRWLAALKVRHYRRVLATFDEQEEPDMSVVRFLVPQGTTALDVGANIGIYTKLLSELVGESGAVVSIEPVPDTFGFLRHNVESLGLGNVRLVNAAASSAEGTVTMSIPLDRAGGANFYEAKISSASVSGSAATRVVRMTTIDSIVHDGSGVSFVKCDVEGHEAACLEGARGLVARDAPAWLIEISGNPDASGATATLFAWLATVGYAPWFLRNGRLRARRPGDRSINYFFLTAAHIAALRGTAPQLIADADATENTILLFR